MAKTESRTELGGSPELPANVGGGVVLRLRRAVHMGHGTTLPQSSPQLVQAAFAVIRPLQSLLPLQHPMSVSGAACSPHKPWAPAVDWQVASLLRWGLRSKCNVSCSLLGGGAGVCPAPPPPARPSALCPQSGAHLHRLNRCLWKTGILRVLRLSVKNSCWEEGRKSQRLQCNVRRPV